MKFHQKSTFEGMSVKEQYYKSSDEFNKNNTFRENDRFDNVCLKCDSLNKDTFDG